MTAVQEITDRRAELEVARVHAPAAPVVTHVAGLSLDDVQEMTAAEFAGHLDGLLYEGGAAA